MTTKQKATEAAQPQVICGGCGYDLQGLADDTKCPECGSTERVTQRVYPAHLLYRWAVGALALSASAWLYGNTNLELFSEGDFIRQKSLLVAAYVVLACLLHWLIHIFQVPRYFHLAGLPFIALAITT